MQDVLASDEVKNTLDDVHLMSDPNEINSSITEVHSLILDTFAPLRGFCVHNDKQVINSEIEAIKKRRNRKFIMFKKTGINGYLKTAQKLSRDLKKR
jgi:hypothetical protein